MSFVGARIRSFRYAFRGLAELAREPNARVHLLAGIAICALAAWLEVSSLDWALLALAMGVVLAAESLNTALEAFADRVAPDRHELVARAKDLAAAGVLLAALAAAVVGALVLGPALVARLLP